MFHEASAFAQHISIKTKDNKVSPFRKFLNRKCIRCLPTQTLPKV